MITYRKCSMNPIFNDTNASCLTTLLDIFSIVGLTPYAVFSPNGLDSTYHKDLWFFKC